MYLRAPSAGDPDWLAMRLRLWPEGTAAEHARDMVDSLARGHFVRVASDNDGVAAGLPSPPRLSNPRTTATSASAAAAPIQSHALPRGRLR